MKKVILGATGSIGSTLAKNLVSSGEEVHLVGRDESSLSALANELKKHHVYLTASINEPGGNHQNEGGLCGLPILFRNSGSLPEYCKGYGVMFNKKNFESALYEMMYEYKSYVEKMEHYPHDSVLCASKYIKLFRRLSKDLNFMDNNDRFYKHPIKTIKSLFII